MKMTGVKRRSGPDSDIDALYKELDEVSCPICMEHPHNAVRLICSSHEKGCRSYICDTSYRHSNCLDRFKKLRENSSNNLASSSSQAVESSSYINVPQQSLTVRTHVSHPNRNQNVLGSIRSRNLDPIVQGSSTSTDVQALNEIEVVDFNNLPESASSLKCPLCRGDIVGWEVVEEARRYLNLKWRSCSQESCSFLGSYQDLRRHARRVHPTSRPSDVDPSREQTWRSLVRQQEYDDVVSAIRSAIPGAVVIGDYVIENGDRAPQESESFTEEGRNSPWWTTLFLFQMLGAVDGERGPRPRPWARHRRPFGPLPERRLLWGENLLPLQDQADDSDDIPMQRDIGEDASPVPRRRRRLARSRSNDRS